MHRPPDANRPGSDEPGCGRVCGAQEVLRPQIGKARLRMNIPRLSREDFGARGVSSLESAALGGAAHLVNFMGTDTVSGLLLAKAHYHEPMAGFSIPAAEHSTITSWGRDNEVKAYRNMLRQFARPGSIVAVVSDSYDIFHAIRQHWGTTLKQEVIDSGATVVIRPDSGDPVAVVHQCLDLLDEAFGHTVNGKGYKVLNHVRVIQGDGINSSSIRAILERITSAGYATDNLAFGMGGALLQRLDRDTQKFALKCSAARVGGQPSWIDGALQDVPIYDRALLKPGMCVEGKAVITQYDSTVLVLPGHRARVDTFFNLLLEESR